MAEIHDLIARHGHSAARDMVAASERRYVDLAALVLGDDRGSPAYLYSGFAMTALPHRRPTSDNDAWQRTNGRFGLMVEPGFIPGPDGKPCRQGVPFGSRARLILLYLQSEAMRTGSPEVRLGNTMHHWLERMGVKSGGSSYAAIRDQARRLSACRLTVSWTAEDGRSGFERANIVSAMLLSPSVGGPGGAWDETARLSPEFFRALREHPLPVSENAIKAIQNSSAVIDIYVWLCYRLFTLTRITDIPWPALREKFGPEYKHLRQFRAKFVPALKEALAVYPGANVELLPDGLRLLPSRPAIPAPRTFYIGAVAGQR
ncbi:replication protein RepA [Azospirillum sp.]|uniref:replication protein RepA n=1 Tax=Azospirillum sp. TaxID=34012 RepID=UPI002D41A2E7|nr:replication protein RepA [Azospirillum sp.]HYD71231.1 replication protein RepA [Azospirillum sp.]